MANGGKRGPFLTVMAILFAVLALSDATKAFQYRSDPTHLGMVIMGFRFETFAANLILGPLTGAFLAAYAFGLWTMRRWVAPLSVFYAFYVPVNLVLFWYMQTSPEIPPYFSLLGYLAVALTGAIGTALYLGYHHERLA